MVGIAHRLTPQAANRKQHHEQQPPHVDACGHRLVYGHRPTRRWWRWGELWRMSARSPPMSTCHRGRQQITSSLTAHLSLSPLSQREDGTHPAASAERRTGSAIPTSRSSVGPLPVRRPPGQPLRLSAVARGTRGMNGASATFSSRGFCRRRARAAR